jgi:hypothetical protein
LVVEIRRLEREQVDARRHVEHAVERLAADELRKHTRLLRLDRTREVERDRDCEQCDELGRDSRQVAGLTRGENGLEEVLRDEQLGGDRDRRDELERRRDQELATPCAPDEPERIDEQTRQVAERAALLRVHHLPPRLPPAARLRRVAVRGALASGDHDVGHHPVVPRACKASSGPGSRVS